MDKSDFHFDTREVYPGDWPLREFETHTMQLKDDAISEFDRLVTSNSDETALQSFLEKNPSFFAAAIDHFRTGHHGTWVTPKQIIRPKINTANKRGLIPDFILGGKSSDGFSYWVAELKGANQQLFTINSNNEVYFTSEMNKAVCQLLEYIDFCSEHQAVLRDEFKLKSFREPNGILIVGRETELDDSEYKQTLKAAWNRVVGRNLEIRTYDWLLRASKAIAEANKRI